MQPRREVNVTIATLALPVARFLFGLATYIYTVWSKKTDPLDYLTITSVNMDRFKQFFHH